MGKVKTITEAAERKTDIYRRTANQREMILHRLKESGLRITNQRKLILDAILQNEYSCCKEIYSQVCSVDPSVGMATVYRMIKVLEDIGAIDRRNMYRICFEEKEEQVKEEFVCR